jgi:hypothetical protein
MKVQSIDITPLTFMNAAQHTTFPVQLSSISAIPFFKSTPHALIYTAHSAVPLNQTPAILKRRADEEIAARTLCKPIEARPTHQKMHNIEYWDFVPPGHSREEDLLVNRIMKRTSSDGELEIIIRVGFHSEEPATYRYFIAGLGVRDEMLSELMDPEIIYGEGKSVAEALEKLERGLRTWR